MLLVACNSGGCHKRAQREQRHEGSGRQGEPSLPNPPKGPKNPGFRLLCTLTRLRYQDNRKQSPPWGWSGVDVDGYYDVRSAAGVANHLWTTINYDRRSLVGIAHDGKAYWIRPKGRPVELPLQGLPAGLPFAPEPSTILPSDGRDLLVFGNGSVAAVDAAGRVVLPKQKTRPAMMLGEPAWLGDKPAAARLRFYPTGHMDVRLQPLDGGSARVFRAPPLSGVCPLVSQRILVRVNLTDVSDITNLFTGTPTILDYSLPSTTDIVALMPKYATLSLSPNRTCVTQITSAILVPMTSTEHGTLVRGFLAPGVGACRLECRLLPAS